MSDAPDAIDWSPTVGQMVGGAVGVVIGALAWTDDDLPLWVRLVFPIVYAVACAVILRMRGVVRYRRVGQFGAHQVAMAVIAGGWLVGGNPSSSFVNGLWFVSALAWWVVEGVRRPRRAPADP